MTFTRKTDHTARPKNQARIAWMNAWLSCVMLFISGILQPNWPALASNGKAVSGQPPLLPPERTERHPTGKTVSAAEAAKDVHIYIVRAAFSTTAEMLGTLGSFTVEFEPTSDQMVEDVRLEGSPHAALALVAQKRGYIYWYDGSRFYIHSASNRIRNIINIVDTSPEAVSVLISQLFPLVSTDAIRVDTATRLLHVSGPRELHDTVSRALAGMSRDHPQVQSVAVIRFGVPQPSR